MSSAQAAKSIQSPGKRRAGTIWALLVVILLGVGGILTAFAAQPFEGAQSWVDRLSKDGSMERFTPALYETARLPLLAAGALFLLLGIGLVAFRRRAQAGLSALLDRLGRWLRSFSADARAFFRDLARVELGRQDLAFLLLLLAAGILLRMLYASRPMVHDEAYTYVAFASRPWLALISDYHLPNNHIFHTILVKITTGLFGDAPWAVRLPALLAGVLTIPAGFMLAKRLYGRWTAVLSAGLIATLPVMVMYSTNARGYSLYTLLTVLLFALAVYLKDRPNRFGWLVFILLSSIGFYTLPMMLYPFGGLLAILLISAIHGDISPDYGSWIGMVRHLLAAGILVGLFTVLLYLPVIVIGTGLHSLVGNSFVERLSFSAFWQTLLVRAQETWKEWTILLPGWLGFLLAAGFLLSIFLHRQISRIKVSTQLILAAWIALALLVQRPNPIARIWTFLIPLFAIWAAAGLVETAARLSGSRGGWMRRAAMLVALVGLAYLGASAYFRAHAAYPGWQEAPGQVETVVQYLEPRIEPGDMVVISSSDGPSLWYYSRRYGIPQQTYDRLEGQENAFQRAYVVVSRAENQTIESAIQDRGLDLARFDTASARLILSLDAMQVYVCSLR